MDVDLILKYFSGLTSEQVERFNQLVPLYKEWNTKINVISRKDIEHLVERHILHSLAIGLYFNFDQKCNVIDIGTGGGFPGIPLSILFPDAKFTLVDAIGKKIKVVEEIKSSLGLTNVSGIHSRSEEIKGKWDYIVSRAVTSLPEFIDQTQHLINKNEIENKNQGIIYLKGGDFSEELNNVSFSSQVFELSDKLKEPFFETKKIVYFPMNDKNLQKIKKSLPLHSLKKENVNK